MGEKSPTSVITKNERKRMPDLLYWGLGITLASLAGIDFAIHHNSAISDPDIREYFFNIFGPIIKNVGNFGLAASAGITIGATRKLLSRVNATPGEETPLEISLGGFSKITDVMTITTVILMEAFGSSSGFNNEFVRDILMTLLGYYSGKEEIKETLHRLKIGRQDVIKLKADGLGYLKNCPTSLNQIFPA